MDFMERKSLLETLSVILIALWFMALGTGLTLNGSIHFLLLGAVITAWIRFKQERHKLQRVPICNHKKE